jgi:hypothetical protein
VSLNFEFFHISVEVKQMNTKMKGALVLTVVLVATAATIFVFPVLAARNGDLDQIRERSPDRLQDRDRLNTCLQDCSPDRIQDRNQDRLQDCSYACLGDQTQTQTRLHIRDC